MIKRGLKEDMTDFLQTPNKLYIKKRIQINKSKQKMSIEKTSSGTIIINSLKSSNKKKLPVHIPVIKKSDLRTKDIDIAMIDEDGYYIACHLKRSQVFAISI